MELRNNGTDAWTATVNGSFTFPAPVSSGLTYDVTVSSQPLLQNCSIANGQGVATSDVSNVNVACSGNVQVSTFAGTGVSGSSDGAGSSAMFDHPAGIAADSAGFIYVTEYRGGRVRKIAPDGTVATVATGLANPLGMAWVNGDLYVAVASQHKIIKIAPNGSISDFAGAGVAGDADGAGATATFNQPFGLASGPLGDLYVTDFIGSRIRKIAPDGTVSTLAGSGVRGFADGSAGSAQFAYPYGIAVDRDGNVYVGDDGNRRVRKISPAGAVSTLAGTGASGSVDGDQASATFRSTAGLAVAADGSVLVSENLGHRIRKITPAGTVSTVAGTGTRGMNDGDAATASFNDPKGAVLGSDGALYVVEEAGQKVRKISAR